jgi:hypothetical protein
VELGLRRKDHRYNFRSSELVEVSFHSRNPSNYQALRLTAEALLSERARPRSPLQLPSTSINSEKLFCRSAPALGRPLKDQALRLTAEALLSERGPPRSPLQLPSTSINSGSSSVGARPPSVAPSIRSNLASNGQSSVIWFSLRTQKCSNDFRYS